jgi:hypothetical protein
MERNQVKPNVLLLSCNILGQICILSVRVVNTTCLFTCFTNWMGNYTYCFGTKDRSLLTMKSVFPNTNRFLEDVCLRSIKIHHFCMLQWNNKTLEKYNRLQIWAASIGLIPLLVVLGFEFRSLCLVGGSLPLEPLTQPCYVLDLSKIGSY